jgi:hypothetical protein
LLFTTSSNKKKKETERIKSPQTIENTRKNPGSLAPPGFSFWQRVKDSNITRQPYTHCGATVTRFLVATLVVIGAF